LSSRKPSPEPRVPKASLNAQALPRVPILSAILRGMPDTEPVADAATVRLFVAVLVCEALTILALWAFGRYFS